MVVIASSIARVIPTQRTLAHLAVDDGQGLGAEQVRGDELVHVGHGDPLADESDCGRGVDRVTSHCTSM